MVRLGKNLIEAVDLFCGAGGLTAGLEKVGILVKAGYDIASECAYAYETNNASAFIAKDINYVEASEIEGWYSPGGVRMLAGCAPCQPFSNYNQGKVAEKHDKWPLISEFYRLVKQVSPELVTMENVPGVTKFEVYQSFKLRLEDLGYHVWSGRVNCENYGLPQKRRRHVLMASKLGEIELIAPTHLSDPVSVRDAIGGLRPIRAGHCDPIDPLHKASRLNELNRKRILSSRPGGTWKDWPEELLAACHRKSSGTSYIGVYGRMEWDRPSPTMTTLCYGYGNGRFGHPEQARGISLREAALLQGFPPTYEFARDQESTQFRRIGRMIGNSVPVRLGEVIGESFKNHVRRYK